MPLPGSEEPQRPRTRAWTKARQEEAKAVQDRFETAKISHSRPERTRPTRSANRASAQPRRKEKDAPQPRLPSPKKKQAKRTPRPKSSYPAGPSKRPVTRGRRPGRQKPQGREASPAQEEVEDTGITSHASNIPSWLQRISSASPERVTQGPALYTEPELASASEPEESMASRPVTRPQTPSVRESQVTKTTSPKASKLTERKLQYRHIHREGTKDERLPHLQSILNSKLPEPSHDSVSGLTKAAQDFIKEAKSYARDSCYSVIDKFSLRFDEEKAKLRYPIINPVYFDALLEKCLSKNEAVLQRTVMMNVFHHYWLPAMFDWNTEGQWSISKPCQLPSRLDDAVSQPKPDLAISFTASSFTSGEEDDSSPVPAELDSCLSPDKDTKRCFPFLFMEVKRAAAELHEAKWANLHSASQALYNMYLWMARAGQTKDFFEQVRVFSFVFNAQELNVRVHRAELLPSGTLSFRFSEYYKSNRISRDEVCLLVDAIIKDYAAEDLHKLLLKTFKAVTSLEDQRVTNKRKPVSPPVPDPKRIQQSNDISPHLNQSFGISGLQT